VKEITNEETGEKTIAYVKSIEFKVTEENVMPSEYPAYYALTDTLSATGNSKIKCSVIGLNSVISGEGYIAVGSKNTAGTDYIFNLEIDKDGP
jgi:hypothetical protein